MTNDIIIGNEEVWDEDHAHDMVLNSMIDDIKEIIECNNNPPEPNEKLIK